MSHPNRPIVPSRLSSATTDAQLLEVLPDLETIDSLEAVYVLWKYDRLACGWITAISQYAFLLLTALGGLMAAVVSTGVALWWAAHSGWAQFLFLAVILLVICYALFRRIARGLHAHTNRILTRARVRLSLDRALRSQVERNRERTNSDIRSTVCLRCVAKFEGRLLRFSYWRFHIFGRCPRCHNDDMAATSVRRIEGWLNRDTVEITEQGGAVVRTDMLARIDGRDIPWPVHLDRIVVATVGEEDVETFILRYRESYMQVGLPRPRPLRCTLWPKNSTSELSRRQLAGQFRMEAH
jgi:hypothetical protein